MKRFFPFFFGLQLSFLLRVFVGWFVNKNGSDSQRVWISLRGRSLLLLFQLMFPACVGYTQVLPALLTAPEQGRVGMAKGSPTYAAASGPVGLLPDVASNRKVPGAYTIKNTIKAAAKPTMPGLPAGVKPAADDVSDKVKNKANKTLANAQAVLRFEQNKGQLSNPAVRFKATDAQATYFFSKNELRTVINGKKDSLQAGYALQFVEANPDVAITATDKLDASLGATNYITNDGSFANVTSYRKLGYSSLWTGVDASFYESEGSMKYDFIVQPNADPAQVRLKLDGATDVKINTKGELEFTTPFGTLQKGKPYTYQIVNGKNVEITSAYVLNDKGEITFQLGEYDHALPLVIDPIALKWSTFLMPNSNAVTAIYVHPTTGRIYLAGAAAGTGFPNTLGRTYSGGADAFITCMEKDGTSLVWSTYFGGSTDDNASSITMDTAGDVYVVGTTGSSDFPVNGTTAAYDASFNGGTDAFLIRLNNSGTTLKYSTFIGGGSTETGGARHLFVNGGKVRMALNTFGTDFPTTAGVYQSTATGGSNKVVFASINTNVGGAAGLEMSTYFANPAGNWTSATDFAQDKDGNFWMIGRTDYNSTFPISANAVQKYSDFVGNGAVNYIVKFNPAGQYLYSSYVAPMWTVSGVTTTYSPSIDVDAQGNVYVAATSRLAGVVADVVKSPAVVNYYQLSQNSFYASTTFGPEVYVGTLLKIPYDLSPRYDFLTVFPTDYANNGSDSEIDIDRKGNIHLLTHGGSGSASHPLTAGAINTNLGVVNAFVYYVLPPSGGSVLYGTVVAPNDVTFQSTVRLFVSDKCEAYITTRSANAQFPITPTYRDTETNSQKTIYNSTNRSFNGLSVFHEPVPNNNTIPNFAAGNNTFCVDGAIWQNPNDGPILGSTPTYVSGDGSSPTHNLPNMNIGAHPIPASPALQYQWQKSLNGGTSWINVGNGTFDVYKPSPEPSAGTVQYRRTIVGFCYDTLSISNVATATIASNFTLQIATPTKPVYYCPTVAGTSLSVVVTGASGNISWQWYDGYSPLSGNGIISPASGTGTQASFAAAVGNLVSGSGFYRLVITDAGGCRKEAFVSISPKTADAGPSPTVALCPGTAISVKLGPTAINPDFDYVWTGPGGFVSTLANPVVSTAGTYTLKVKTKTDATFCAPGTSIVVTASTNHDAALINLTNKAFCQDDTPAAIGLTGTTPSGYVFQWVPGTNLDNQQAFNPVYDPGIVPGGPPVGITNYTFTALRLSDGCVFERTMTVTNTALAFAFGGSDRVGDGCTSGTLDGVGGPETTGLYFQWTAIKTDFTAGLAALKANAAFGMDALNQQVGTNKFLNAKFPLCSVNGNKGYYIDYEIRASYIPFANTCFTTDTVRVFVPCCGAGPSCPTITSNLSGTAGACGGATTTIGFSPIQGATYTWTTYSINGVVQPAGTAPRGLFVNNNGVKGAALSAGGSHPATVIVDFDDASWGWSGSNVVVYEITQNYDTGNGIVSCSTRQQVFSGLNGTPKIGVLDLSLCTIPLPGVRVGTTGKAGPYTLTGANYTQAPNSAFNWTWTAADGTAAAGITANGTTPFPTFNPTATTAYKVVVRDVATGCIAKDTLVVSVKPIIVNAGPDLADICPGSLVQLGTEAQAGLTYTWSPSAGLNFPIGTPNSTVAQPYLTVPGPATATLTYTLNVTDTETGCQAADNMTIGVTSTAPPAIAAASYNGCANGTFNIGPDGSLAGATYAWTVPGGTANLGWLSSTSVRQPVLTLPAGFTGPVVFRLTVTKGVCGSVFADYTINSNNPTINLGGPYTANCSAPFIQIGEAALAGYSYSWSPYSGLYSDNALATAYTGENLAQPWVRPTATTTYTVTRRNDVTGCLQTATVVVNPPAGVAANAGPDKTWCPASPAIPIGASGSGNLTWSAVGYVADLSAVVPTAIASPMTSGQMLGYLSGTSAASVNFVQSTVVSGQYVYRLTSTNGGCSVSDLVVVKVSPVLPTGIAGLGQNVCPGGTVRLGASTNPTNYNYRWTALSPSNAGGTIDDATAARPFVTPTVTTTYQVVYTNASTGCSADEQVTVVVNPKPVIADVSTATVCQPIPAQNLTSLITNYGSLVNPVWYKTQYPGGVVVSTPTSVSISQTTTFFLVAENSFGCKDTAQVVVNVSNPPTPNIATSGLLDCTTRTFNLATVQGTPSVAGNTLEWHSANNTLATTLITNLTVGVGTYYLFEKAAAPANCYSGSAVISVTNTCLCIAPTSLTVTALPNSVAPNATVTLTVSASNTTAGTTTYTWSGSGISAPTATTVASRTVAAPATVGTYTYTVVVSNGTGCTATAMASVTVPVCTLALKPTVSGCYSVTGASKATVSVEVSWENIAVSSTANDASDEITVTFAGQTKTINPGSYTSIGGNGTIVSPQVIAFEVPADATTQTAQVFIGASYAVATCKVQQTGIALPAACPPITCIPGQAGGTVWNDYNADGTKQTGETTGIPSVTVSAFDCVGNLVASTVTDAFGKYVFTNIPLTSYPIRVEFSNLPTYAGMGTLNGTDGRTTVQVVNAPDCSIDLGVLDPTDYCQTNPKLVIPCYVNGDPLLPISTTVSAASSDAVVSFDYNTSGKMDMSLMAHATASQVGSLWGMAYNKFTKKIFSAATVKRHAGLGPLGLGGIYVTDFSTTPANGSTFNYSNFLDVSTIGINVGTIASNSARGLVENKRLPSVDNQGYLATGKVGIGGIDLSEDGNKLYLTNLFDNKLYEIDITAYNASGTLPTDANVKSYDVSAGINCTGGNLRIWAVKVHKGKVYTGMVCDAGTSQSKSDLRAFVQELNGTTGSTIFDFPLTYPKGYVIRQSNALDRTGWYPWTDNWTAKVIPGEVAVVHPEPIFSAIEFDIDGSMVLAFSDRTGFQAGVSNYNPNGHDGSFYSGYLGGDILRAYSNGVSFVLENNAKAGPNEGYGADNNQGPGFGEFYNDNWVNFKTNSRSFHAENVSGGLALRPGSGEAVVGVMDPVDYPLTATDDVNDFYLNSGGVRHLNNQTGILADAYQVYSTSQEKGTFSKAVGLGDLVLICDTPTYLEIGNRLWVDEDKDGIQDPCEKSLPGVLVTLYQGTTKIASTTTDANGEYYFNNSPVSSTVAGTVSTTLIQPNTAYTVRFGTDGTTNQYDNATGILTTSIGKFKVTTAFSTAPTANTMNDSNVQVSGSFLSASVTTGAAGSVNHTIDAGFICAPTSVASVSAVKATCPVASTVANSDAKIMLSGIVCADKVFLVVAGGTIPSYTATGSQPVSNSTASFTGLTNPATSAGRSYSLVLYNGPCCYTVVRTTLAQQTCVLPSLSVVVATPICNSVTNNYTATGMVSLTNVPGSTTLTITDNGVVVSTQSLTAAQTSANFSVSGVSNTASHTVIATLTGGTSASTTYAAPASCTVCSLSITTTALVAATVGAAYSQAIVTTGGTAPLTYTVVGGSLPTGLSLNVNSGVFSGTPTVSGTASFTVKVTDNQSCSAIVPLTLTVLCPPVSVTVSSATICAGQTATLTAMGGTGYLWSTGATTASIPVSATITTSYSVTGTTTAGCSATASGTLTVNPSVTALISPQNASICAGQSTTLTALGGSSYRWSTGATTSSISVSVVGTYSVTATSAAGCSGTATTPVTVNPLPMVTATSATICAGQTTTLTASGASSYLWSTGANMASIQVSATATTTYSVTGTTTAGCSSVGSGTLTVNGQPQIISITQSTACVGNTASLTVNATNTGAGTLEYSLNGGAFTTSNSFTIAAPTATTASVVVRTMGSSCTATQAVVVNCACQSPVSLTFVPTTLQTCADSPVSFTVGVSGASSATLTSSGTGTFSQNVLTTTAIQTVRYTPSLADATAGSVTLTLTSADPDGVGACVADQVMRVLVINPAPSVSATSATICAGGTTLLVASGASTYVWSTGATTAAISVSVAAVYSVTGVSAQGCSATAVGTLTVLPQPVLSLQASSTLVTVGTPVSLSAIGCVGTLTWSTNQSGSTISVTPSNPTNTYSATCTTGPGCTTIASVTVNTAPSASLVVISATVCYGSSATLTASGCTGTVTWSNNTTGTSLVTPALTATTNYTATCTTSTGSTTSAVGTATVMPQPVLSLQASSTLVTVGTPVSLSAIGCVGTLTWSTNQSGSTISVTPSNPTNTYSATCTTGPGCTTIASVTVNTTPSASLVVISATVCYGSSATLIASGCTGTVTWSNNTTGTSLVTPALTATTNYTATCTTSTGSTTSAVGTATVMPQPSVTVTALPSTSVVMGSSITLVASGCLGGNLSWSTGATSQQIIITPTVASLYSVTCTTGPGCQATAQIRVGLVPTTLQVAVTSAVICAGQPVSLSVANCGADLLWSTGATTTSITVNPTTTTAYSVVCSDQIRSVTASSTITVNPAPSISLTASSTNLVGGQSVTLTASGCQSGTVVWSTGATGVMSQVVSPTTTATYSVTCTTGPPCSTTASVVIGVGQAPKLALSKVVSKAQAKLGEVISYTVTLVNTGGAAATNVVVRDSISGMQVLVPGSVTTSVGSFSLGSPVSRWGIASLPAGATATLTFSASLTGEGIVYNTATIPGDTNTVCTTVPLKFCKDERIDVELNAPAGYSTYQWYRNGMLIALATGSSYTATEIGEYSVQVNQGQCLSGSCCPVIIELDSVAIFTLMAQTPSCVGGQPRNDGRLTVKGLGLPLSQYRYAIAEGSSFTVVNPTMVPVPTDGVLASNLIGDRTYTVRIYNGLGCYRDVTQKLVTNCICPADICVPTIIKKTKSRVTLR